LIFHVGSTIIRFSSFAGKHTTRTGMMSRD
jgi:hypothetical protein